MELLSTRTKSVVAPVLTLFLWLIVSCGKSSSNDLPQISNGEIINPDLPTDTVVHESCINLKKQTEILSISAKYSEIAFALRDLGDSPKLEWAVVDSFGGQIPSKRRCTNDPATILLRLETQQARVRVVIRDSQSDQLFSIENAKINAGQRINYGVLGGSKGRRFKGVLEFDSQEFPTGVIEELGWKFNVNNDGTWSSGSLPNGVWSIKISGTSGKSARWTSEQLTREEITLPNAKLTGSEFALIPLWNGNLNRKKGSFLISAPLEYIEMRASLDHTFVNSFWEPFTQVVELPFPTQGKHQVFIQLRDSSGRTSNIISTEVTVEILDLSLAADAKLEQSILSVFNPSTTVSTTAPQDATHHSLTVDVDDLHRVWTSIDQDLPLTLPKTLASCGSHTVYIRFRSAQLVESESLTRTVHVRCWERDVPTSPLAPRYDHSSIAITLSQNSEDHDAVLIWGGRDSTQAFNDGAILKKENDTWVWEQLPSSPLSARSNPMIAASSKNILIYGGEDSSGTTLGDWAFYDFQNKTWTSSVDTSAGTPPPTLKNSAIAYLNDLENTSTTGMFIIVGGEKPNETPATTITDKYYVLFEDNGSLSGTWYEFDAPLGVSRATSSLGNHNGFLYVHSGIIAPTGPVESGGSGNDFDLTGDLQVFAFYTDQSVPEINLIKRRYRSNDSRTGALQGHPFFLMRELPNAPTPDEFIEKQIMCIYGAQKYSDSLPNVCEGNYEDGKLKMHQPFCRRIYDSYLFAPVGRLGMCLEPVSAINTETDRTLRNYFLAIEDAPKERRIQKQSTVGISSTTYQGVLFIWSGLSATGGEYLSDGRIYFSSSNRWVPVTQFESPAPRHKHSATHIRGHSRILIWGGQTAAGVTSQGAFYAIPEN